MFTRFKSTDPVNAPALNQRFQELSDAVDDVVRSASEVGYTPAVPADWNPDPTTVQGALDDLAARLILLSNHLYVSGLEVTTSPSANTLTIAPGVCASDNGQALITVPNAIVLDMAVTGINGLESGVVGNNLWYSIWLCKGTSGVGAIASNDFTKALVTLPAGYDQYVRRIATVRTNGSAMLRAQTTPIGQGAARRVIYTEVTNAAPFQILNEVDIGTSGAQTTVDCSGIVAPTSRWVTALIECNTPAAAVDVFWNPGTALNTFIMSLPATAFTCNTVMDLEVPFNSGIGRIYSSGAGDEDLSFVVLGYIDDGLGYLGYTP